MGTDDYIVVFCKSFYHVWLRRRIYAPPGKAFRLRIKRKK
jgi:hypothetical protein